MRDPEARRRELNSLAFALELMGFDTERLSAAMVTPVDHYVRLLSLRSTCVAFDHQRAREVDPSVSPAAEAAAASWFETVRRKAEQTPNSGCLQPRVASHSARGTR